MGVKLALVVGLTAALLAPAEAPGVVPLGCGITWTRTGGVWIYQPDCPQQPPPSQPPPSGPPSPPPTP
ncbi:hypothetical protein [Mycobacterium sp. 1081908.1]|uniref:hypothetical protein n=1 Tax=Mycobacterium sp. 1081908.1 TaxID=1834066 RepID=UPI0012EA04D6|nr:hypothetical protein [Mycobacterium sp. 1081908.1]